MDQLAPFYDFSLEILDNHALLIAYNSVWYQDDICLMKEVIIKKLPAANTIESLVGADRESLRFSWRSHAFMLHFEYYSQSCWIEAESEPSHFLINDLMAVLNH